MSEENLPNIVSVDEVYGIFRESDNSEIIIDVRNPDEFAKQHVEESINVPALKVAKSSFDLTQKKRAYIICQDGSQCGQAAKQIAELHQNVKVFYTPVGGFTEWIQKKYPVVSNERKQLKDNEYESPNDADFHHIQKTTRVLPQRYQHLVNGKLPESIRLFYFEDGGRCSYLLYSSETGASILLNPIMEIHHFLVDQVVRLGSKLETAIYFSKPFTTSKCFEARQHAQDFAEITGCQISLAAEIKEKALEQCLGVSPIEFSDETETLKIGALQFTQKVGGASETDQSLPLFILEKVE